ncbi:TetR family transcriptional regulator [Brevibacterium sp. 2SA]|uniref:TetR/AcrR family transcriptional regulator n=1 Tax=Brevibacterium sp. 2SA TaxID=2502198 RepID=UPI0010F8E4FD|nr:TetR family transcriptional regulator [Brevibacterium sp. 2SA]
MREDADPSIDGRRRRGDRSRQEIIDATLALIERDGAAGVTHRRVAREARVASSLPHYYFATLDDLLVAALTTVADAFSAMIRAVADGGGDPLRGLAEVLVDCATRTRTLGIAERELSTLASRRPALVPTARRWRDDVADIGRLLTDDPDRIEAFVAVADGVCTAILLGSMPADADRVQRALRSVVDPARNSE